MSMLRTDVFFATGLPKDHGWSRAWECSLPLGTVQICLALHGSHARAQGGNFRYDLQQSDAETVEQVYQVLTDILDKAHDAQLTCSLVVLVTVGQIITVFAHHGAVVLERNGKRRVLLAPSDKLAVREGAVQAGDQLLLCTQESWRTIQPLLEKVSILANLQEFVLQSQRLVRNVPDSSTAAVVGITYSTDTPAPGEVSVAAPKALQPTTSSSSPLKSVGGSVAAVLMRFFRTIAAIFITLAHIVLAMTKRVGSGFRSILVVISRPGKTTVGAHVSPKKVWLLLLLLFVLLALTIAVTYRYQQRAQFEQQIARQLEPYQQRLVQIEQLADVNPIQSRDDLLILLQDLSVLEQQIDPSQEGYQQITDFLLRAQQVLDQFAAAQAINELPIFKDMRTISPSFLATAVAGDGKQAILLDSQQQFLISLDLFDRIGQEKILPAEIAARSLSIQDDLAYLLGNGIHTLDISADAVETREVLKADEITNESSLLANFTTYVYLLNPTTRAIYRYTVASDGLSARTTWIGAGSGVPFDTVTSMVVDGSIWLGTSEGRIIKLQSGETVPFSIEEIPSLPNSAVYLATNERTELLYILEPAQGRVLSVDKATGNVLAQVENSALGSASGLVLDEVNNQLLAMSGSLLFSVPIGVSF